ncbi:hypothetical protein JW824_14415 [bacterium]|nr:hypothetical protein [bacterium]
MKRIILTAAFLLISIDVIYSQETYSKNFQVMMGVTGGVSELRYADINCQLYKKDQFDGLSEQDHPYGLTGMVVYKNKAVLSISILYYGKERRSKEDPQWGVTLSRSSVELKLGFMPNVNGQNIVFPYIGLDFATMSANNHYPYYLKGPGSLFHSGKDKWIVSNLGLLYGLKYVRSPRAQFGLGFGVEIGGSVAITNNPWYEEEDKPFFPWYDNTGLDNELPYGHPRFDPGGYFVRFHVYIRLL